MGLTRLQLYHFKARTSARVLGGGIALTTVLGMGCGGQELSDASDATLETSEETSEAIEGGYYADGSFGSSYGDGSSGGYGDAELQAGDSKPEPTIDATPGVVSDATADAADEGD